VNATVDRRMPRYVVRVFRAKLPCLKAGYMKLRIWTWWIRT